MSEFWDAGEITCVWAKNSAGALVRLGIMTPREAKIFVTKAEHSASGVVKNPIALPRSKR
ncbi:MAG TPA: hypothetical protein PKA58_01730 [Polyangium sp.]|nr:hypothetical protein [Polyangium sp.]